LPAERLVREAVAELNERIVAWQRSPTPPHVAPPAREQERKISWWHRVTGRSR
jgi:hypothetical protein